MQRVQAMAAEANRIRVMKQRTEATDWFNEATDWCGVHVMTEEHDERNASLKAADSISHASSRQHRQQHPRRAPPQVMTVEHDVDIVAFMVRRLSPIHKVPPQSQLAPVHKLGAPSTQDGSAAQPSPRYSHAQGTPSPLEGPSPCTVSGITAGPIRPFHGPGRPGSGLLYRAKGCRACKGVPGQLCIGPT